MNKSIEVLNNDDVISVVNTGNVDFYSGDTLKVQQIIAMVRTIFVKERKKAIH